MNNIEYNIILKSNIKLGKKKYRINTQSLYQGVNFHVRRKLMYQLKLNIKKQISEQHDFEKNITFPLHIYYKIYHNKRIVDIDNISYIYIKAIHDVLKELNIIPDDNNEYINKYSVELIKNNELKNDDIYIKIDGYERSIKI